MMERQQHRTLITHTIEKLNYGMGRVLSRALVKITKNNEQLDL